MLPVYLPVHHFGSLFCWTAWPLIFCHLKCSFLHSQNHLRLRSYLISCIHMKFVLRFWHLLTCTCTWSHTLRDRCCTLERWTAIHRGAWAYGALLKGPQPWQGGELPPLQLSVHQSFLSGESGNHQPSGYWTTYSHHWATATPRTLDLRKKCQLYIHNNMSCIVDSTLFFSAMLINLIFKVQIKNKNSS